jgi:hypothetical protein
MVDYRMMSLIEVLVVGFFTWYLSTPSSYIPFVILGLCIAANQSDILGELQDLRNRMR